MLPSPENLLTPYATRRRPPNAGAGAGGWFDLDDWVGPGHPSGRADVAKLEAILANSGDFPMERFQGPTGYWGGALDAGIRSYQKRNGLTVDGTLRPGGPTISHMRDSFANLFDGYELPTPEDIDAHQNVVGDDNPGTIAWRRPAVDLSQVPGLPEIDQAADASNARLVRAMLRTGDIEGYAPLMRDAIDQGGKHALAEVRDLTQKLDEASPGLGDRFAGYVFDGMEKAKRDRLRIKMQGGQPPGTKVAITDTLGDAGLAIMGGLLGAGTIGAGIKASGDTSKINDRLPGFTPADNENKPAQTPPPALVDVPIDTGHPVETPKASDNIETFPAAPEEKRQQIVDDIRKDLFPNYVEMRYGDREENRATDDNAEITNIIIETFMDEVKESHLPDMIHHKNGGSFLGKKELYKEERTIQNNVGTFNRPDGTFQLEGAKDNDDSMNFNVQTPRKDGTPIEREQRSFDRLSEVLGKDSMKGYPKRLPNQNLEDHKREAKAFAVKMFKEYENRLWNLPGPR
jgi:peptidoglycan hydrolase-like protein with peptidoglycan-binding domain